MRRVKLSLVGGLLAAAMLGPGPVLGATMPPPAPPAAVAPAQAAVAEVINFHQYGYQDQVLWVVGELQNKTESILHDPVVHAQFVDGAGNLVAEFFTPADATWLPPGGVSTFRVTLDNPPAGAQIATLNVSGTTDDLAPYGILYIGDARAEAESRQQDVITEHQHCDPSTTNCYTPDTKTILTGNYMVNGTVKNSGNTMLTNVRVSAALYDLNGTVINTGVVKAADQLAPGQEAAYHMMVYWAPGTANVQIRTMYDSETQAPIEFLQQAPDQRRIQVSEP